MGSKKKQRYSQEVSQVYQDLEDVICLLALITDRYADPESLLPSSEDQDGKNADLEDAPEMENEDLHSGSDDIVDGIEEVKDLSTLDTDRDGQRHLAELQNKVLDRLAETLARFKTDSNKRPSPDAKHVSSAMMVVYKQPERVKIFCSKNEGLDEEDRNFLNKWKVCMEAVAKTGTASEKLKDSMFELVFAHQRPRIMTYLGWLKRAFQPHLPANRHSNQPPLALVESQVSKLPCLKVRKWTDDNELEYEIPLEHAAGGDEETSEAVWTGQSFKDVDVGIDEYFQIIEKLCDEKTPKAQERLLKQLMCTTLHLWKGARTRSAVKSYLHHYFGANLQQEKQAKKAILCLCKIYHCVCSFVEAAEKLPMFKSVKCVEISPNLSAPKMADAEPAATPLDVSERLGLHVKGRGWTNYLNRQSPRFASLVKERRRKHHFHAEIQALYSRDILLSPEEREQTHPYIGCSRRCCWLCYAFLLLHSGFKMRGTHETVMYRWDLPADISIPEGAATEFLTARTRLLDLLKKIVQGLFDAPHPSSGKDLLAQSSCALSSAQVMVEQEVAKLERPSRETEQLMMMPFVSGQGIMAIRSPEQPEYAFILGGGSHGGEKMLMSDAELLKDNYLRLKLGLESLEQREPDDDEPQKGMPPKGASGSPICRLCKRPSSLRCSACRTDYCSKPCQKKDWTRHMFTCRVNDRPRSADVLKFLCKQWAVASREDGSRKRLLLHVYSDDDFCWGFGFTGCLDESDVDMLFYLYRRLLRRDSCKDVSVLAAREYLGFWIGALIEKGRFLHSDKERDKSCREWFQKRRQAGFDIPSRGGPPYAYQAQAVDDAERLLSVQRGAGFFSTLPGAERAVLKLYLKLLRKFNNMPDSLTFEWLNFGFCYCSTEAQSEALAAAYIELAKKTPIDRIAKAWVDRSLGRLMQRKGIDVPSYLAGLQWPSIEELGIYRLMAEVSHSLCGYSSCPCFRKACKFHSKYETLLCKEEEGDYGFHGASPWERWQLLNFYAHVFKHPRFDARKMQAARRDADPNALEAYLDALEPGFRSKIGHEYLADALFPKLNAKMSFPNGRPLCACVAHNIPRSCGLDAIEYSQIFSLYPGAKAPGSPSG